MTKIATRSDARRWLREIITAKQELDAQWENLAGLIASSADSPFARATWKPLELLIECVSELVCDQIKAIEWYVWDNDCGAKALQHSLPDGTMICVHTIDDLLDILGL